MPRGINNWTFQDVVDFLEQHNFSLAYCHGGSHHYYRGFVDNIERLVEVQYHGSRSFKPKTFRLCMVHKSGIPEKYWIDWAEAGNYKRRKTILYPGAAQVTHIDVPKDESVLTTEM